MFNDCFPENYILVKGDCEEYTTPTTGLYINDLPGLSLRLMSKSVNDEEKTGVNMAKIALSEGINRVRTDFLAELSKEFTYNLVTTNNASGNVAKPPLSNNLGTKVVGRKFVKVDCDRFTRLHLGRLKLYLESAAEITFNIIDGKKTTPKTFSLVQGLNTVNLDYTAETDIVVVSYDQTDMNTPDELQCGNCGYSCDENYSCLGCGWHSCAGYTSQEVENTCWMCGGSESVEHYAVTNEKSGLSIEVTIVCSEDALLCTYSNQLKYAIRYAQGIHIIENALSSPRSTPEVRNTKEELKDLLVRWDGVRNETTGFQDDGKYQKEIGLIVKRALNDIKNLNSKTRCISCNGFRSGYSVP